MNMLSKYLFCLLTIVGFSYSCNSEEDSFVNHEVTFYLDHPLFSVMPAQFETISEEVLVREQYNVGATLEIKTEEVLVSEAFTSYQTFNGNTITIINDLETNTSIDLTCREFLDSSLFIETEGPARYMTRQYEVVLVNGNGAFVPAQYGTRTYTRVVNDSQVVPVVGTARDGEQVVFRLPFGISVDDYIQSEMSSNGVSNCFSSSSYFVN